MGQLKPIGESIMAEISFQFTKSAVTGYARFEEIKINFQELTVSIDVAFEGIDYAGLVGLIVSYNKMLPAEKPTALKFIKMMVADSFNSAMGTTYTWDQVPNSIFT